MDIFILAGSVGTFLIFLALHVLVLRQISDRSVIPVFWMTYVFVSMAAHVFLGIVSSMRGMGAVPTLGIVAASFLLSTLLTGNYFMGIFGVMESSIRMRVLGEVVRAGRAGVSRRTLLTHYNHMKIVDKRLARFVASGDIERMGEVYVSRKPFTFFLVPALMLHFFWWVYGRTNIVYSK
ncbi:MAG: hypothetical protein Q8L37_02785 [Candidatus Gottesmanbacteria bacterium]|nr:hypothetical protein [Candidatus Gottesmanbacteria bacterium]